MAVASALTDTDSSLSLTLDGLDVSVSIQSPEESRMTREKLLDLQIAPLLRLRHEQHDEQRFCKQLHGKHERHV